MRSQSSVSRQEVKEGGVRLPGNRGCARAEREPALELWHRADGREMGLGVLLVPRGIGVARSGHKDARRGHLDQVGGASRILTGGSWACRQANLRSVVIW